MRCLVDSSSAHPLCYRDQRYVLRIVGNTCSPQEENNEDSDIGFIGYQPVAEPQGRFPK